MRDEEKVQAVVEAVKSGAIATADYAQLVTYSSWLSLLGSNRLAGGIANFEEVSKVVHAHLMRSVIEAFERRSKVQAFGTLVFAVLAIVATIMPYFIAPNPGGSSSQTPTASVAPPCTSTTQTTAQSSAITHVQPVPTAKAVSATERQPKSKTDGS
jgi:hypothetical protein